MDLERAGWLGEFLGRFLTGAGEVLAAERTGFAAPPATEAAAHARRHVEAELRRSGLIYGLPRLPPWIFAGEHINRADALFYGVLANECLLALDVAWIYGAPLDTERAERELSALLAAAVGRIDLADRLHLSGGALRAGELEDAQRDIEIALVSRLAPPTGDLRFDLPLHNGLIYSEARLTGRLAALSHRRQAHQVWRDAAERLAIAADRERATLLQALLWLANSVDVPIGEVRPVLLRLLRRLRLPREELRRQQTMLRQPPTTAALAEVIRPRGLRRFIVEQALLTQSLLGEKSIDPSGLLQAFGHAEEGESWAAAIAERVPNPEPIFDAFELRAAKQAASGSMVERLAKEIALNLGRVNQEVQETKELAQLLTKAAMGQRLTKEERDKAREQLIDLAKVVPSLAILAAPGGTLIFAALLKVLPFSILPSAFQTKTEEAPHRRSRNG